MGSQQILLIVLTVVIVGIAIAVGITMFNNQAKNSARQAIISEMASFAGMTYTYLITPASMGGSSHAYVNWDADHIARYIGVGYDPSKPGQLETDNAIYIITIDDNTQTEYISSIPKESLLDVPGQRPKLIGHGKDITITYY